MYGNGGLYRFASSGIVSLYTEGLWRMLNMATLLVLDETSEEDVKTRCATIGVQCQA